MDLSSSRLEATPSWGVILVSVAICAMVIHSSYRPGQRLLTPLRLFLLSNVGGLGIAYLRLDDAMTPWIAETWIAWIMAIVAYSLGSMGAGLAKFEASTQVEAPGPTLERLLFLLFATPFFIAIASGILVVGTFPVFAAHPEEARLLFAFHSAWSGWFLSSAMVAFPLGARVLALGGRRVWMYHVVFWAIFVCQNLAGIRGVALFGIFCLASQFEMRRGRLPIMKIAGGVALFMIAFVLVALLRLSETIKAASGVSPMLLLKFAAYPPYAYIANCYWNLDFGIQKIVAGVGHPTTWGFSTASGILDMFAVGQDIGKSLGFETIFNEKSAKIGSLNTFSFVWPLYKDGGLPFVVVFSFAWGLAVSLLHRVAVARGTFGWQLVSSYITFASLFSFFALYFTVGAYLFFLVPILVMAIAVDRSRARKASAPAR